MRAHPGRGSSLGYFVLLGTHMFEPKVTAPGVILWKCSSRGSQGCILALFMLTQHLSSKLPLSCEEKVVLRGCCSGRCPAIPRQPQGSTAWGVGKPQVGQPHRVSGIGFVTGSALPLWCL